MNLEAGMTTKEKKEKWTDQDRVNLLKEHNEVSEKFKDLPVREQHALIAERIARKDFAPTTNAVADMISMMRRTASAVSLITASGEGSSYEKLTEITEGLRDSVQYLGETIGSQDENVTRSLSRIELLITKFCSEHSTLYKSVTNTQSTQTEHIDKMLMRLIEVVTNQAQQLGKIETSLGIMVDLTETLVNGLREVPNG